MTEPKHTIKKIEISDNYEFFQEKNLFGMIFQILQLLQV